MICLTACSAMPKPQTPKKGYRQPDYIFKAAPVSACHLVTRKSSPYPLHPPSHVRPKLGGGLPSSPLSCSGLVEKDTSKRL